MLDAHPVLRYWRSFSTEFAAFIKQSDEALLNAAWRSRGERTRFYRDRVVPGVAGALSLALSLELRPELFRRDFAMRIASSTGHRVPLIFVESENEAHFPQVRGSISAPAAGAASTSGHLTVASVQPTS